MMLIDVDMESYPIKQQESHNINTGTTTIEASHADLSAMQYQSLKSANNMFKDQMQSQILPFSPQMMQIQQLQQLQQLPQQQPPQQSVFVIDSNGTEEQQIDINTSTLSTLSTLPIIHEDEEKILKDLEIDSLLYSSNNNDDDDDDVDMKSNEEDLTIKIKSEENIFNPEIRHIEVTHPERQSAQQRASILLDRAFASSPVLSPELSRLSKDFININRNSSIQLGFGRDFTRLSQNLFAPISDDFRISDQYRFSQEMQSPISPPIPPPYISIHDNNINDNNNDNLSSSHSSHSSHSSSMTNIKEKHRACKRCHKVKKKCVRSIPGAPCNACSKKGIYCESRQDGRTRNKGKKKINK